MTPVGGAGRRKRQSRPSERLRRLIEEALVDAYGEDEQPGAFLVMLGDRVACPFTTLVVGEEVEVRGFDWAGAPHEIVALCRRKGRTHSVNFTALQGAGKRPGRRGVARRLPGLAQRRLVATGEVGLRRGEPIRPSRASHVGEAFPRSDAARCAKIDWHGFRG